MVSAHQRILRACDSAGGVVAAQAVEAVHTVDRFVCGRTDLRLVLLGHHGYGHYRDDQCENDHGAVAIDPELPAAFLPFLFRLDCRDDPLPVGVSLFARLCQNDVRPGSVAVADSPLGHGIPRLAGFSQAPASAVALPRDRWRRSFFSDSRP